MIFKLFIFLLPLSLFATEVVWDGTNTGLSESEQRKAVKEYIQMKYPKKFKAWENHVTLSNGLMWQDNGDAKTIKRDWIGAKEYCRDLELAGFTDWYLPNREELESIVDKERKPRIKKEFQYCASSFYWSSSPGVSRSEFAWGVYFEYGYSSVSYKTVEFYVRCARAGQ